MDQETHDYVYPDDFQLPGEAGRTHVIEFDLLYETDDQWSECVDLAGYRVVGLIIPDALDAGATTFGIWVCQVDDTDYAIGNSGAIIVPTTGAALAITLGATPGNPPQAIGAEAFAELSAFRWVKLYLDRSQTADRTFYWVVKG